MDGNQPTGYFIHTWIPFRRIAVSTVSKIAPSSSKSKGLKKVKKNYIYNNSILNNKYAFGTPVAITDKERGSKKTIFGN